MPADLQSAPFGRSGNLPDARRRRARTAYRDRPREPNRAPTDRMRPIRAVERGPVDGCWMVSRVRFGHAREHRSVKESVVADASFDIVSKIDRQEADNALNQAAKEVSNRFDFRGVGASIAWSGESGVEIRANSEERANAVLDVFKEKLVKRGVSLKHLDPADPKVSGKEYRITVALKEG